VLAYASLAKVVQNNGFEDYMFWTNGPAAQSVNYLHFHLGVNWFGNYLTNPWIADSEDAFIPAGLSYL